MENVEFEVTGKEIIVKIPFGSGKSMMLDGTLTRVAKRTRRKFTGFRERPIPAWVFERTTDAFWSTKGNYDEAFSVSGISEKEQEEPWKT